MYLSHRVLLLLWSAFENNVQSSMIEMWGLERADDTVMVRLICRPCWLTLAISHAWNFRGGGNVSVFTSRGIQYFPLIILAVSVPLTWADMQEIMVQLETLTPHPDSIKQPPRLSCHLSYSVHPCLCKQYKVEEINHQVRKRERTAINYLAMCIYAICMQEQQYT